jgi:hypothetical protein
MGNDSDEEKLSDEMIDATLADSFPASDPPSKIMAPLIVNGIFPF